MATACKNIAVGDKESRPLKRGAMLSSDMTDELTKLSGDHRNGYAIGLDDIHQWTGLNEVRSHVVIALAFRHCDECWKCNVTVRWLRKEENTGFGWYGRFRKD